MFSYIYLQIPCQTLIPLTKKLQLRRISLAHRLKLSCFIKKETNIQIPRDSVVCVHTTHKKNRRVSQRTYSKHYAKPIVDYFLPNSERIIYRIPATTIVLWVCRAENSHIQFVKLFQHFIIRQLLFANLLITSIVLLYTYMI